MKKTLLVPVFIMISAASAEEASIPAPHVAADIAAALTEQFVAPTPSAYDAPADAPESDGIMSRISVNTSSPLDMNWTASMDSVSDPDLAQTGGYVIPLPFLDKYPIENLEIKLKLLHLPF